MNKKGQSLEQSLDDAGLSDQHLTHRLGELLTASGHLTEDSLSWALLTSGEIGVPLGHVLIQTGVVAPALVGLALTTQRQIRMKAMTREEAVQRLKSYESTASSA